MQVRDPTVRFSGDVADQRRSRAATCGEWFRLGDHAPDLGRPRAPLEGAVIGASARALTEAHLEQTVAIIGIVGGLLADLGFRVSAAGPKGSCIDRRSSCGWVATRPGRTSTSASTPWVSRVYGSALESRVSAAGRASSLVTLTDATPSSGAWSTRSAACFGETAWMTTRSRGSS